MEQPAQRLLTAPVKL